MARVRARSATAAFCADRRLAQAGHHEGHGAMDADGGHAARGGDLAAAGQPLSAPARSSDGSHGYKMVRYADDFVILCRSGRKPKPPLRVIRAWVAANGLTLHPDKTQLGDCRKPGQGFDFLGYRFEAGKRRCPQEEPERAQGQSEAKDDPDAGATASSGSSPTSTRCCAAGSATSSTPHPACPHTLDGFVRRRLRAILRKQEKRPGFGRCQGRPSALAQRLLRGSAGCSPFTQPGSKRDTPDEETTNWRAVCGKTARTVRREGRRNLPYPYRHTAWLNATNYLAARTFAPLTVKPAGAEQLGRPLAQVPGGGFAGEPWRNARQRKIAKSKLEIGLSPAEMED